MSDQAQAPWPVNDLERALEAAARDRTHEPAFIQLLLAGEVHLFAEHDVPTVIQPGGQVALRIEADANGREYIACFTSLERLRDAAGGPTGHLRMPARDLFAMVRDRTVTLNPHGPYGKEFLPDETSALLNPGGSRPVTLRAGTQVMLASLAAPPEDLIAQVKAALKDDPRCRAAAIGGVTYDGTAPHPVIGLDCGQHYHAVRAIVDPIFVAWAERSKQTVDLVDMRGPGAIEDYLRRSGRVILKRSLVSRLFGKV